MVDYFKEMGSAFEKTLKQKEEFLVAKKEDNGGENKRRGANRTRNYDNGAYTEAAEERGATDEAYNGRPARGGRGGRGNSYRENRGGARPTYNERRNGDTYRSGPRGGMEGERRPRRNYGEENRYQEVGENGDEMVDTEGIYSQAPRTRGSLRGRAARGAPRGSYPGSRGGPRGSYDNRAPRNGRGRGYSSRGGAQSYRDNYDNQYQNGDGNGYYNENNGVAYQSNEDSDDDDLSSEPEPLTEEQLQFIDEKTAEFKSQLKGIVSIEQIQKKCYDLEFDDEKFNSWANSLHQTDKRVAGLKEYEWNDTVTKEEKFVQRVRKLAKIENLKKQEKRRAEQEIRQKEWAEKQKIRDEKRMEQKRERDERRAKEEAERKEKELEEGGEPNEEGQGDDEVDGAEEEAAVENGVTPTDEEEEPLAKKSKYEKKGARGGEKMIYQRKGQHQSAKAPEENYVVKNGAKTLVYKKKGANNASQGENDSPVQPVSSSAVKAPSQQASPVKSKSPSKKDDASAPKTAEKQQYDEYYGEQEYDPEYVEGAEGQEGAGEYYAEYAEEVEGAEEVGAEQADQEKREQESIRRKNSEEESELLRLAADQNQQRQKEERERVEKERLEAKKREEQAKEKKRIEAKEKAEAEKREKDEKLAAAEKLKAQKEEERKAEEQRLAQKKKDEEAAAAAAQAATQQQQQSAQFPAGQNPYAAQNPYFGGMMGTPGMMPQMVGLPQMMGQPATGEKNADGTPAQPGQNVMMEQNQLLYQQMVMHQQMFQQYQAMLAQQLAMQQQIMTQGGTAAAAGTTPQTVQSPNAQNPYAAMGGMGSFPMMPNMAAPGMIPGSPAMPGVATTTPTGDVQNPMGQQQFMPMAGFMPAMPIIYPTNAAAGFNQQAMFQNKNEDK